MADGARHAVNEVSTVGGVVAFEVVTLHDAGEALALSGADDVDQVTGFERVGRDLLADRVAGDVGEAQLDELVAGGHAVLGEVTGLGLVELSGIPIADRDLNGAVAIGLRGLDLDDAARPDLDNGDGNDLVVVPHLRHADLLANYRFVHSRTVSHAFYFRQRALEIEGRSRKGSVSLGADAFAVAE